MTHLLRHLSVANFVYFRPHQEHSRSWGSLLHQTHPLGANLLETSLEITATQKYYTAKIFFYNLGSTTSTLSSFSFPHERLKQNKTKVIGVPCWWHQRQWGRQRPALVVVAGWMRCRTGQKSGTEYSQKARWSLCRTNLKSMSRHRHHCGWLIVQIWQYKVYNNI